MTTVNYFSNQVELFEILVRLQLLCLSYCPIIFAIKLYWVDYSKNHIMFRDEILFPNWLFCWSENYNVKVCTWAWLGRLCLFLNLQLNSFHLSVSFMPIICANILHLLSSGIDLGKDEVRNSANFLLFVI